MSGDASSARDPVDLLIERFLELHRAGEPVTPEGYAEQHPAHAGQLMELLPTLLQLEEMKRDRASTGAGPARVALPSMDRLGDFRIERELGRGGMGVVFEAVQESLNRRVALKVLPQASLLTGNQLKRFQREAQTAARLHHTNIVPVYGSGETEGYHWYAMQFIAGQSLDRWRAKQATHPPSSAGAWRSRARFVARVGVSAASALHCAHGHGTLHRDVKPGNFLLDQEDDLWVTDFGLAKALENEGLTNSGDLLGTLQYMAPEQFSGQYDVRSEVYALGVTLYEMLTLAPAFAGQQRSELMERVRGQRFEPLAKACPDLPKDLAVIIGKAMAREPQDRYPDALALQHDLEAFLEDRPVAARRLSALAQAERWCRRNRGIAAAMLVTLLAVVGAAVTGWYSYGVTQGALRLAQREGDRAEDSLRISQGALQLAQREGERAESNLRLSLDAFGDVFDALVGRDPVLDFEEDPETGEETVVVQSTVRQDDVILLQEMLAFYDRFATANADSESLRYETARARRRVGAIHAQLGSPTSLETAQAAFGKALEGFQTISDRDVRRDVANVQVDLGKLYERQGRTGEAREHFEQALALLAKLPGADSAAGRLLRAEVLFERYRTHDRFRWRREGPWGSADFCAAMALLGELMRSDGSNPDVRALTARCLREEARGPGGRALEAEVLEIFRALASDYPDRLEFRSEFCKAVLARARRPRGAAPRDRRSRSAVLADLQEAERMAADLFAKQPLFREPRTLLLQVRTRRASVLYRETKGLDAAEVQESQRLAYEILGVALADGAKAQQEGLTDLRFVTSLVSCRANLGWFKFSDGDRDAALAQAGMAVDLFEQHLAAVGPDAASRSRRPEGGGGRPRSRANWLRGWLGSNWDSLVDIGRLFDVLDDESLRKRLQALSIR